MWNCWAFWWCVMIGKLSEIMSGIINGWWWHGLCREDEWEMLWVSGAGSSEYLRVWACWRVSGLDDARTSFEEAPDRMAFEVACTCRWSLTGDFMALSRTASRPHPHKKRQSAHRNKFSTQSPRTWCQTIQKLSLQLQTKQFEDGKKVVFVSLKKATSSHKRDFSSRDMAIKCTL